MHDSFFAKALAATCSTLPILLAAPTVAGQPYDTPTILISQYELHEPTNGPTSHSFGTRVAVSADGRTLAVADPWYFGGREWPWYGSGAVHVYVSSARGWLLQARLEPPEPEGYDLGADIALSENGDVLAVGAEYEGEGTDPTTGDGAGSVFVFTRTGGVWSQQAYLRSSDPQPASSFGRTVELSASGQTLAVGAPFEALSAGGTLLPAVGSIHVYDRTPQGRWAETAILRAPQPQADDRFGMALRLSANGETMAVLAGEQNEDTEDFATGTWGERNNTLYVFERTGQRWDLQATLEGLPSEPFFAGSGYLFEGQSEGFDLRSDGKLLAVASPSGVGADGETGYVAFYERGAAGWAKSAVTVEPMLSGRIYFGLRLALSPEGSTLAAAVHLDEGPYGRPCVVMFAQSDGAWQQTSVLEPGVWPDYTSFGNSLSLSQAGQRLAVGARSYTTATTYWGAAFVY